MTIAVLITQCLQHDFVAPLRPHDQLPNRLHVGSSEALRLHGPDPAGGPLAQLMAWARQVPGEHLAVIHIRDWHDPADPAQAAHLERFGPHCLRGTPGAAFAFGEPAAGEAVIDSLGLNDFEGTGLAELLRGLAERHGGVRVGVVGVWTEAKVSFLLYDLATRLGIRQLATCSALTASASRGQHFNALEQLGRILGVEVIGSVGEFQSWLAPGTPAVLPSVVRPFGHQVLVGSGQQLDGPERDLLAWLYRDSANVELETLGGGFSGARVFRAAASDPLGQRQAPSVVKLGPSGLIAQERVAFERVEEVLGNRAPSIRGFADLAGKAGIKYSFASMGPGKVRTFKDLAAGSEPVERAVAVLDEVFGEILAPFAAAARYERLPLLDHYGFAAKWASNVRQRVEAIAGAAGREERLPLPDGTWAMHPALFYERILPALPPSPGEFHYQAVVHGDLNGANILSDGRDNVWLIDWFHAGPGHVLKDLAKLENDLLFLFTRLEDRAELVGALAITRALNAVEDLRAGLPAACPVPGHPRFERCWTLLRRLRAWAGRWCRDDRHPQQLRIALLRYAVHTLSFDEASPLQKEWALAAAALHAEAVTAALESDRLLRVDWLAGLSPGGIGLTICPGRRDRGRELAPDLLRLRQLGTTRILCLLGDEELEWAGIPGYRAAVAAAGLAFRQMPLLDQTPPAPDEALELGRWLMAGVAAGERSVVHCYGGLGRAGTIAACALVAAGAEAAAAIAGVRAVRGPRALETAAQEGCVAACARLRRG